MLKNLKDESADLSSKTLSAFTGTAVESDRPVAEIATFMRLSGAFLPEDIPRLRQTAVAANFVRTNCQNGEARTAALQKKPGREGCLQPLPARAPAFPAPGAHPAIR
ncbi:MAG: hypothetical protein KME26_19740 [Oscillatoria princeps RMCB-10]|nr:hypothetical protein [Oscillatoria princeps RMCB-10]